MQEFNKLHVYHINSSSDNGGDVSPGDGALLASDFGDWLDLPSKSNQIFDEQILIQYKLDLMSYPKKAILYLAGQFGLNSAFEGSEITIGVLPLNTRPKHQLKQNFTVQATECYLQIETTGEVKLIAVSGDLPVAIGVSEPDPYFLNVDYNPQIEEDTEPTTYTAERRQFFTRNNCTGGASGTAVEFVKNYSSTISQADADTKASNDPNFNSEGQAFANNPANGATCVMPVEYIATRTESFTRNNCAAGASGTAVNFTKNYTSGISQADADNKAATDPNFATEGQAFANDPANGAICVLAEEYLASRTQNFTRNNCGNGYIGSAVSFTKHYTSGMSQADADNKAATDPNYNTEGQAYANNPVNGATCQLDDSDIIATIIANPEETSNSGGEISYDLSFQVYLSRPLSEEVTISGGFQYLTYPVEGGAGQGAVGPNWSVTIPAGEMEGVHDGLFLSANSASSIDTFTYPGLACLPSEIGGIEVQFSF